MSRRDDEQDEEVGDFLGFVRVQCPYCFETVELDVDPDTEGELVQDCEVCCNPWSVRVTRDEDGHPIVEVERAQ